MVLGAMWEGPSTLVQAITSSPLSHGHRGFTVSLLPPYSPSNPSSSPQLEWCVQSISDHRMFAYQSSVTPQDLSMELQNTLACCTEFLYFGSIVL